MNTYVDYEGDNVDVPEQGDEQECVAQFVDGSWDCSMCGCEDCRQAEYEAVEHDVESGSITEAEALERHALNDAVWG